jgi:hypothetical protein
MNILLGVEQGGVKPPPVNVLRIISDHYEGFNKADISLVKLFRDTTLSGSEQRVPGKPDPHRDNYDKTKAEHKKCPFTGFDIFLFQE